MYAEIAPVKIVRNVAGMRALGALPNAAIPKKSIGTSLHYTMAVVRDDARIMQLAMSSGT